MQYHVSRNGQQFGPYEEGDLGAMILSGNVASDDTVWTQGMPDWRSAGEVFPHLFRQPMAPSRGAPAPGSNVKVVGRPHGAVAGARPGQAVVRPAHVRGPQPAAYGHPQGHGYPHEQHYGVMPQRVRPPAGAGAWLGAIFVDLIILAMCLGPAWWGINEAVKEMHEEKTVFAKAQIAKGLKTDRVPDSSELYGKAMENLMDHQPWTWISIGLVSAVVIGNVAFLTVKGRTVAGALLNI